MTESFEEDLIDTLIQFTRNKKEIASITYLEFKDIEEVYPILNYFEDNLKKALDIFRSANYPIHPMAYTDVKETLTCMREDIENNLEFAISPWSIRSSIRYRFVKPPATPDLQYIGVTLYTEIRTIDEEETYAPVVQRTRASISLTLPIPKEFPDV